MKTHEIRSFKELGNVVTEENVDMLSGNLYGILLQFVKMKKKHPEIKLLGFDWTDNGKIQIKQPKLFKMTVEDESKPKKPTLHDIVYDYHTKYRVGFIAEEIKVLLEKHYPKITQREFNKKMGVVTCQMQDGNAVYYHCDVELAIRCCLEKRDQNALEFD